jgi:hypothetical protein
MQWQLGVDHKDDFVCTGPKYQYEANPNGDGVHLSVLKNHSKAVHWGQLRDSDPFKGIVTQQANPNYCVSFDMPVP